jgi:hypothetical protein
LQTTGSDIRSSKFKVHELHGGRRMKLNPLAISVLAFTLGTSGLVIAESYATPQEPPAPVYVQEGGWDAPPAEFRDIQRQGFHDGIEGARKDFDNHRPPNVEQREEFRHPHVPASARHDYRDGFRRGYQSAWDHLSAGR